MFSYKNTYLRTEQGLYNIMCTCYIPPENSRVYKRNKFPLSEYDLHKHLSTNIRNHSTLGHKYTTGDLNSGTDQNPTYLI